MYMRMSILWTGVFLLNRTSPVTFHEEQNRPRKCLYTLPATSRKVHFIALPSHWCSSVRRGKRQPTTTIQTCLKWEHRRYPKKTDSRVYLSFAKLSEGLCTKQTHWYIMPLRAAPHHIPLAIAMLSVCSSQLGLDNKKYSWDFTKCKGHGYYELQSHRLTNTGQHRLHLYLHLHIYIILHLYMLRYKTQYTHTYIYIHTYNYIHR